MPRCASQQNWLSMAEMGQFLLLPHRNIGGRFPQSADIPTSEFYLRRFCGLLPPAIAELSMRSDRRRLNSAKALNRGGGWCDGSVMGIGPRGLM
jgi:hypothetical protein